MEKTEEHDDSTDKKVEAEEKSKSADVKVSKDSAKSKVASQEKSAGDSVKEKDKIKKETIEHDAARPRPEPDLETADFPSSSKNDSPAATKVDSKMKVKRENGGEKENDRVSVRKKDLDFARDETEDQMDNNNKEQKVPPLKLSMTGVSGGVPVHNPPATTASHLYSVLMAPLDSRSPYQTPFHIETESGPRKRMRLDNLGSGKTTADGSNPLDFRTHNSQSQGMDLTKNRKRKLKKKNRKQVLNKVEIQRAKDFIYSSENEQYSVEKLRTMIEDVTEFLDAIWDVYCSEARLKGESVEDEGYKAAAVLKCLSTSGEGSWADLQLLSRAKSVLVLRSKNLAASTISRVETELGYDPDIRTFIVQMLRFWMNEVIPKG